MITLPFCTQAGNLKDHLLTHSGEKTFPWTQCNFSCTTSSHLKRHIKTHSGEKQFSCDKCNYSSNQAGHLKEHMRQHSGEKPFACKQCNFSCRVSSHVKRHMLSHTGEKPYYICKSGSRQLRFLYVLFPLFSLLFFGRFLVRWGQILATLNLNPPPTPKKAKKRLNFDFLTHVLTVSESPCQPCQIFSARNGLYICR